MLANVSLVPIEMQLVHPYCILHMQYAHCANMHIASNIVQNKDKGTEVQFLHMEKMTRPPKGGKSPLISKICVCDVG
jgi:hypothetical protein